MDEPITYVREPGFLYCETRAAPSSAHAVARGWTLLAARCGTAVERAAPDACSTLYFNLGPNGRHIVDAATTIASVTPRAAWVIGPHAQAVFVAKETVDCNVVALRILPGTVAAILGVSAVELTGRLIDLDLFWGRSTVNEIRERLFYESDPLARIRLLEQDVARRALVACRYVHNVRHLCSAVERLPNPSIRDVAATFGMPHRKLIALFDDWIGLKPKEYQRVRRLRRVLEHIAADRPPSWAQLAVAAGYFDQAHFAREFKRLTGVRPTSYVKARFDVGTMPHALADPLPA